MKKLLVIFMAILFATIGVQAKQIKNDFQSVIKDFGISKESVAISVRDLKTGNVVYSLNDNILMNPASVQKALTLPAAVDKLGENYVFSTELFSRGKDSYIIKLSGDPFLKSGDLKTLVKPVKSETKNIYIDDTILDSQIWGEGWQWDDDMNILMPRFGSYNLDKNLIKITVIPAENGQNATVMNSTKYPLVFLNNVKTSNKTDLNVKRDINLSPNVINLSGTVARPTIIYIPVNNIESYFKIQLTNALENKNVYIKNPYVKAKIKSTDKLESKIEHSLSSAIDNILKNSDNFMAETVFKLSGGGTDKGGIKVFNEFCTKHGINNSEIKITDGSGVSKNNLVTADFVSKFLFVNKDNSTLKHLAKPSEGTLTQRMLPLKDSLSAKTGTLSNVSSIAGYLKTKKGSEYSFCIIQNDVKMSESDKKMLEDSIIKELYLKG